jgi:very-short-patch-repair endonuclease
VSKLPVSGTATERIATLAGHQNGRVARRLLAAGVSGTMIGRLVDRGYLTPEHPGVYAAGHRAPIPGDREAAALLAVRAGAALSHRTARRWWGLGGGSDVDPADASIHLTLPGARSRGPRGVIVHRSTILTARDLRLHDGLPVTSPARTLLDVACELPARDLERAHDEAIILRVLRPGDIAELLRRAGRHAGRRVLEELVTAHTHPTFTRSEAEERFLALVRGAALIEPLVNTRRHGYEIDFLWPDFGFAVEIDGYAVHDRRRAFERDRARDAALYGRGIVVIRITWHRLTTEPLPVVAELAAALARRSDR